MYYILSMKLERRIFSIFLCGMTIASQAIASDCSNKAYRKNHPEKCSFFAGATMPVLGGAGLLGGVAAALGFAAGGSSGGSNGGSGATPNVQPTMQTYNMVGGDVDSIRLANAMNTAGYNRNINQYNDIRLAYSLARGYTGRGSEIAVLDAGTDTWHGATVAAFASGNVAPDAVVKSYKITDQNMKFLSYGEIGNKIAAAGTANIYNASWSVEMRANQLRTRAQLVAITDKNFVNQIANAATSHDAIFVWAAGNDYDKAQSSALSAMPIVVPELRGHFINVVAWDSDTGALADYSNACGITQDYCITAPGTNLDTGKTLASGTSFAAPIVSAAVAVIREAFPYMTSPEITALLFATARDLGAPGVDEIYGHGMLDLERATRPVGAALVPLDNNMMQPLRTARVSGTIGHNIKSSGLKFAYFDQFGRAFSANLNDNITIKNPGRGFERLRGGDEISAATIGNMEFGLKRSDFVLGDGFLQSEKQNLVSFIGTKNDFQVGEFELFQRTRFGFGAPKASPNSMITSFSNVYTASVAVGARYGDWTFSVAMPETIISGNMNLRLPAGRIADGTIIYNNYQIDMTSKPAIEYSVKYKYLTASFIDNPYGTDEFFIMAKRTLRF